MSLRLGHAAEQAKKDADVGQSIDSTSMTTSRSSSDKVDGTMRGAMQCYHAAWCTVCMVLASPVKAPSHPYHMCSQTVTGTR